MKFIRVRDLGPEEMRGADSVLFRKGQSTNIVATGEEITHLQTIHKYLSYRNVRKANTSIENTKVWYVLARK